MISTTTSHVLEINVTFYFTFRIGKSGLCTGFTNGCFCHFQPDSLNSQLTKHFLLSSLSGWQVEKTIRVEDGSFISSCIALQTQRTSLWTVWSSLSCLSRSEFSLNMPHTELRAIQLCWQEGHCVYIYCTYCILFLQLICKEVNVIIFSLCFIYFYTLQCLFAPHNQFRGFFLLSFFSGP